VKDFLRFCYTSTILFSHSIPVKGQWTFVEPAVWQTLPASGRAEAWVWEKDKDWESPDWEDPSSYKWIRSLAGGAAAGLVDKYKRLCAEIGGGGAPGVDPQVFIPQGPSGVQVTMPVPSGTLTLQPGFQAAILRAALGDCASFTADVGLLESDPGPGPEYDINDIFAREFTGPGYARVPVTFTRDETDPTLIQSPACWTPPSTWATRTIFGAFLYFTFVTISGTTLYLGWVLGSPVPIPFVLNSPNCYNISVIYPRTVNPTPGVS